MNERELGFWLSGVVAGMALLGCDAKSSSDESATGADTPADAIATFFLGGDRTVSIHNMDGVVVIRERGPRDKGPLLPSHGLSGVGRRGLWRPFLRPFGRVGRVI